MTAHRERWVRRCVGAMLVCLALFATGVGPRPDGEFWAVAYDLVLYNAIYLAGALVCLGAARRDRADRMAWCAMALAMLLAVIGNLVYSLVIARMDVEPFPSVADAFYLGFYLPLYVGLVAFMRTRVPRFHMSMWLDGLIGALGAAAVAIAVLLGPALRVTEGDTAAVLTSLAYPVADILLLALLGVVGGILGLRRDVAVIFLVLGILANLVGDIVFVNLATQDVYVEGGPLDLTWLVGVALLALAADSSRRAIGDGHAGDAPGARVSWRVMAVPLVCNFGSLAVLGGGWGDHFSAVAGWCALACIATSLVRSGITFREMRDFQTVRDQARTDELTGLANRRALLQHAERVTAAASARHPAALLLLDLDGFKEVNDSLGHSAGDALLSQVGPRISATLGPADLLARLGGDEFAVLLPEAGLDEAYALALSVRARLLEPFTVEGIRLHVGASIGVATAPVPAATVQELLRCADVAMYAAKTGREGVHVYVPDPAGGTGDRLRTMEELRTALDRDQLLVHLQPQVALTDGRVIGAEALVRWQHPRRGLLSPAELLPAAEQAGLMRQLTDTVLDLSLDALTRWWPAHRVPVSVNLSAANVTDLDLPKKVMDALARHDLPAEALTLELVEDTLMADPDRGRTVLGELRRLGVRTSIDDYGTGYSSLAYLRHLPADELKLDRSLTADVGSDDRAAAIVEHTVALAHALGLRLVAEGVEDDATGAVLARLGCDIAQGYAIGRPMPVTDFIPWLDGRRALRSVGTPVT